MCISLVLNPQLRGNKQLFTGDAAFADGRTHGRLIEIGGSGINQSIAGAQCVGDRLFAQGRVRNLKDTKAF